MMPPKTKEQLGRDFEDKLSTLDEHIPKAEAFALDKFRRFPNLTSVSVNIGAAFFVSFAVILTWARQPGGGIIFSQETAPESPPDAP